jgi:starch phosphorylase
MIGQYARELYQPAHFAFAEMEGGEFAEARRQVEWSRRISEAWENVRFLDHRIAPDVLSTGVPVRIEASVDLAGLASDDVRVEAVAGRIGAGGGLEGGEVVLLGPCGSQGSAAVFEAEFAPVATGRLGVALRITPNHFKDPLNRPCNALMKWAV